MLVDCSKQQQKMPSSLEDYEVVATIGSGSYGTCKKIRRKKDGKILVWKELDYGTMTEVEKQMLVSEVNLLRELKHQHIVRYYDRIIDRSNTMLYIIMEFCEGGDVGSLIAKMKREGRYFEEDFIWQICYQIILALKECHWRTKNGKVVLHRDLKPANIFLDGQNNVKLGDFGLARVLSHETSFAKTFVGTPYYMSPEQMNYESYNEKSDVWSLGCLLYEMCALRPPFTATTQAELASRICNGTFTRIPMRYSDDLNKVISCMLRVEEHKRPTIADLQEHPVILKCMETSKRKSSSSSRSSDSGHDIRYESLRKWEETLKAREQEIERIEKRLKESEELLKREDSLKKLEKQLTLQEKEIDARIQSVILREKLAEERMARAERMMKEATQLQQCREISESRAKEYGDQRLGVGSILTKGKKVDSPKKHVSFRGLDKENGDWYSLEMPEDMVPPTNDIYRKLEMKHTRNMIDLRAKMRQAKLKSEELRRGDITARLQNHQITTLR